MEKIILIRHTEAEGGDGEVFRGRTDMDLVKEGYKHAKRIGKKFRGMRIDRIYSSMLKRAVHTAEEIANQHNLKVIRSAKLNEMSFGIFDGHRVDEMKRKYPDIFEARERDKANFRIPGGGENYADVRKRALSFILAEAKKNPGKTLVFVIHGSVIKSILMVLLKDKGDEELSRMIHYGCRIYLEHDRGVLRFQRMENDFKKEKVSKT